MYNAIGKSKGQTVVLDSLIDAADKKMDEYKQRVSNRFQGLADKHFNTQMQIYQNTRGKNSTPQAKPEKIIQGGVEYTLNPETGEYE